MQLDLLRRTFEGGRSESAGANEFGDDDEAGDEEDVDLGDMSDPRDTIPAEQSGLRSGVVRCSTRIEQAKCLLRSLTDLLFKIGWDRRAKYRCLFSAIFIVGVILMAPVIAYVYKPVLLPMKDVTYSQIGAVTHDTIYLQYRLPTESKIVRFWSLPRSKIKV